MSARLCIKLDSFACLFVYLRATTCRMWSQDKNASLKNTNEMKTMTSFTIRTTHLHFVLLCQSLNFLFLSIPHPGCMKTLYRAVCLCVSPSSVSFSIQPLNYAALQQQVRFSSIPSLAYSRAALLQDHNVVGATTPQDVHSKAAKWIEV